MHSSLLVGYFGAGLLALGLAGVATAQEEGAPQPDAPAPAAQVVPRQMAAPVVPARPVKPAVPRLLPLEDRRFLAEAAAAGRYELDAARLALAKSANARVRSLAEATLRTSAVAFNELALHAYYRGMAAPMLTNPQRKTLNRLAKLQGPKFDREYLRTVAIDDRRETGRMLDRASREVKAPQLRSWIGNYRPTVQAHLTTAEEVLAPKVAGGAVRVRPSVIKAGPPGTVSVSGSP